MFALLALGLVSLSPDPMSPALAAWRHSAPPANVAQASAAPFTYAPPPPPDRGSPETGDRGGGSRGGCPEGDYPLTALVPEISGYGGQTVNPRPTFWVAVPFPLTDQDRVELLLRTPAGDVFYRSSLVPEAAIAPGLMAFSLPDDAPVLEEGVYYDWYALIYCDAARRRSTPTYTSGWVQRVSLAPELEADLGVAAPTEQSRWYAAQGLWYDAVNALAPWLQESPTVEVEAAWSELLRVVSLEPFSQLPFQPCCALK